MHYELEDYVVEMPLRVKCENKCLGGSQTYTEGGVFKYLNPAHRVMYVRVLNMQDSSYMNIYHTGKCGQSHWVKSKMQVCRSLCTFSFKSLILSVGVGFIHC